MKESYEQRTKIKIPRRTYTLIRIDGKAFHTLTKKIKSEKPFDTKLMDTMDATALHLCNNIQGAQLAYVQSDEISILLTDFETIDTEAWFDGNVQKMASVSASLATSAFNRAGGYDVDANFDSRVWQIPDAVEVVNYFVWRWQDWERNSIQMLARSLYSHKELHKKNVNELHDLIHAKGQNWADLSKSLKNGRLVVRKPTMVAVGDGTHGSVERNKCVLEPMYNLKDAGEKNAFKALIPFPGYE